MSALARRGWCRFPAEPRVARWAEAARIVALDLAAEATDWRCGGTWWPGVDALPNDAAGAVAGMPLEGAAIAAARGLPGGDLPLHRAQLSVCLPGYPRPDPGESDAAARYRRLRDAAHLDGLLPIGPERRRMLREPHAWILGLPLTGCDAGASPLAVWEGSHEMLRDALGAVLRRYSPEEWSQLDLTETYQAARRACFERCRRVELPARPGEALLLHRLVLHGIAPWAEGAQAPAEGRITAYFRPQFSEAEAWLAAARTKNGSG